MLTGVWIFVGGGLGAVCRWLLSGALQSLVEHGALRRFPLGIGACNLLGCFAIGVIVGALAHRHVPDWVFPLLVTGFLGGFTTFSTFANDTRALLAADFATLALVHVLISTLGGIALAFLGLRLGCSLTSA